MDLKNSIDNDSASQCVMQDKHVQESLVNITTKDVQDINKIESEQLENEELVQNMNKSSEDEKNFIQSTKKLPYFQQSKPNFDEFISITSEELKENIGVDEIKKCTSTDSPKIITFEIENEESTLDVFKNKFKRQITSHGSSSGSSAVIEDCSDSGRHNLNYKAQLKKHIKDNKIFENKSENLNSLTPNESGSDDVEELDYNETDNSSGEELSDDGVNVIVSKLSEGDAETNNENVGYTKRKCCQQLEESSDEEETDKEPTTSIDGEETSNDFDEKTKRNIESDISEKLNDTEEEYEIIDLTGDSSVEAKFDDDNSADVPPFQPLKHSFTLDSDNDIEILNSPAKEWKNEISILQSFDEPLPDSNAGFNTQDLNQICSGVFIDTALRKEKDDFEHECSGEESSSENKLENVESFFDNEAELSGDDASEDESENDEGNDANDKLIVDSELPSDEELRNGISDLYMKKIRNDDNRLLQLAKEKFLDDEISNGTDRKRKYKWSKNEDFSTRNQSESEGEQETECPTFKEKTKWQFENEHQNLENIEDAPSIQIKTSIKINILGKSASSNAEASFNQTSRKRKTGSMLALDKTESEKYLKKAKEDVNSTTARAPKMMTFGAEEKNNSSNADARCNQSVRKRTSSSILELDKSENEKYLKKTNDDDNETARASKRMNFEADEKK